MKIRVNLLLLLALLGVSTAQAKVVLPSIFSDNAILQRNSNVLFWGKATPTREVLVIPSWTNESYKTQADADGNWQIEVPTPDAGQAGVVDEKGSVSKNGYVVRFDDGQVTEISNILLGEVWLCSGQSNMEMPMKGFPMGQYTADVMDRVVKAKASTPIRTFTIPRSNSNSPMESCKGSWAVHSPEMVSNTSAAAYFFAEYVQEVLGVPVGLVVTSWGGSNIEAWMSAEMLTEVGEFDLSHLGTDQTFEKPHQTPSCLYNAMIYPIIKYRIKGMLWYQGEANKERPEQYPALMSSFVSHLRKESGSGEFPFYYAEIAPYGYPASTNEPALMREAMAKGEELIPNCGMISLLDAGEEFLIHPSNKKAVGDRFAYWALGHTYGIEGVHYRSPKYKEIKVLESNNGEPSHIAIKFDHAPNGICFAPDTPSVLFEVAGADQKFYPAKAKTIRGNYNVEVWSDEVPSPVAVRYGFKSYVKGDLFSTFGLPVSSFRSDDWPVETK